MVFIAHFLEKFLAHLYTCSIVFSPQLEIRACNMTWVTLPTPVIVFFYFRFCKPCQSASKSTLKVYKTCVKSYKMHMKCPKNVCGWGQPQTLLRELTTLLRPSGRLRRRVDLRRLTSIVLWIRHCIRHDASANTGITQVSCYRYGNNYFIENCNENVDKQVKAEC